MKMYKFTREAKYVQYGFVNADSEEEALELIEDGDYDDIYDTSLEEEYNDTIKITCDEEKEEKKDEAKGK